MNERLDPLLEAALEQSAGARLRGGRVQLRGHARPCGRRRPEARRGRGRHSVHAGSAETFYAVVALQPERDLAVAVVANAAGEAVERAAASTLKSALAAFTVP